MKNKLFKELIPYIIIIVSVILVRSYIITPVRVSGPSMNDTLHNGNILLLSKMSKNYERMDIVVFEYKNERLIKRIIGLPGEHVSIKDNVIYINGEKIEDYKDNITMEDFELNRDTIPDNYYFVMGDNRTNSVDSRIIGLIKKDDIKGKIVFSVIPFKKL